MKQFRNMNGLSVILLYISFNSNLDKQSKMLNEIAVMNKNIDQNKKSKLILIKVNAFYFNKDS